MDKNCINTAACFFPGAKTQFDVTCHCLNYDEDMLATGTKQGVVILWKIYCAREKCKGYNLSPGKFKELYENANSVTLDPYFMFVVSNNSLAFPVVKVAFANGFNPTFSLEDDEKHVVQSFKGVGIAEEILVSLHRDNTLCIWSLNDCRCLHKVRGPPFPIRNICVLPDRRFIALVGDYKINVIDIWRLSLIEVLQLKNLCGLQGSFDPDGISKTSLSDTNVVGLSSDDSSLNSLGKCSPPAQLKEPYTTSTRIVLVSCGLPPARDKRKPGAFVHYKNLRARGSEEPDANSEKSCPLLLAALLDNSEIAVWDLTPSIAAYKYQHGAFNGSIMVVTEWDLCNDVEAASHVCSAAEISSSPSYRPKNIDRWATVYSSRRKRQVVTSVLAPIACEYIHELGNSDGKICVVDRFIFVLVGYRILVWLYEMDGYITRVAELLAFANSELSTKDESWKGLKCLRVSNEVSLLLAWPASGEMSVFFVPRSTSAYHFKLLGTQKFPPFEDCNFCTESIQILINRTFIGGSLLETNSSTRGYIWLSVFYFNKRGGFLFGKNGSKSWKPITTFSLMSRVLNRKGQDVSATCIVDRNGTLYKVELLTNGKLRCVNLMNDKTTYMISPYLIKGMLDSVSGNWKLKQFAMVGSRVMKYLEAYMDDFQSSMMHPDCSSVIHPIGTEFVVIGMNTCEIMVNSLRTLKMELFLNGFHFAPIKSIYSVHSALASPKTADSMLLESTESFVSVDLSGALVLVNIPQIIQNISLSHTEGIRSMDISEDLIYSDDLDNKQFTERGENGGSRIEDFIVICRDKRGIYRMEINKSVPNLDINRIVTNFERDTLFVLTCDDILLWRISTGSFLRRLSQLDVYRQALLLSSEKRINYERELRSGPSFTDTITSFWSADWQQTNTEVASNSNYVNYIQSMVPNYLLSLAMFSENCHKRKITSSALLLSSLRVHFVKRQSEGFDGNSKYSFGSKFCKSSTVCKLCEDLKSWKIKLRIIRTAKRKYGKHARQPKITNHLDKQMVTAQCVPLIIFPISNILLENKEADLCMLKVLDQATFCYLGIPHGTISIPLYNNFLEQNLEEQIRYRKRMVSEYLNDEYIRKDRSGSCIRRSYSSHFLDVHKGPAKENTLYNEGYNDPYVSTCLLLHYRCSSSLVGLKNIPNWERRADPWLLARLTLNCASTLASESFSASLKGVINSLSDDELNLHVSKALTFIRCAQSFRVSAKVTFPQICICRCRATTFTFGTRCGFCLKPEDYIEKVDYSKIHSPKAWEEEAALLILVLVSFERHLYSLCNLIKMGVKHYTFASYVISLLLRVILSPKIVDQVFKKSEKAPENECSNLNNYFLGIFSRGFGTIWSLSTFERNSILPEYIRSTKLSTLFRKCHKPTEEAHMDGLYFVLNAFEQYHITKKEYWSNIVLLCFSQDTKLVLHIIKWIVKERKLGKLYISTALQMVISFTENFKHLSIEYLPDFVGIIIRCLDPSDPNTRIFMLESATSALFYLVKNFPMVAFHQDTQRFAVGSTTGHVVIYDVRSATKWRVFGVNQKNIASIAFSSSGDYIAAYYIEAPCLVIWRCSATGLLDTLLNNTFKEHKIIRLKKIPSNPLIFNKDVKIQSKSNSEWFLHREDGKGYMIST